MRSKRYYQIRTGVRVVFWTSCLLALVVGVNWLGHTLTEMYYGVKLP